MERHYDSREDYPSGGYFLADRHSPGRQVAVQSKCPPEGLNVLQSQRAGTEHRVRAQGHITGAHADGFLDDEEYTARLAFTEKAKTVRELQDLVSDVPVADRDKAASRKDTADEALRDEIGTAVGLIVISLVIGLLPALITALLTASPVILAAIAGPTALTGVILAVLSFRKLGTLFPRIGAADEGMRHGSS